MSGALTADRIAAHATRLGLTHLADTITELVARAETAQTGGPETHEATNPWGRE